MTRPIRAIDVIWFNYPTYLVAIGVAGACVVALVVFDMPALIAAPVVVSSLIAAWWLIASIAAAAWVFQWAEYGSFTWLPPLVRPPIATWLNLTAGFDATTESLRRAFPDSVGRSVDVFDPAARHDGALLRARHSRPPEGIALRPGDAVALESGPLDAAFMIMSAHELEPPSHRETVLRDLAGLMRPDGELVLVEFIRSWRTVLVFGPGAGHFLSKAEWSAALVQSEFRIVGAKDVTPFVHAFVARRAG